MTMGGGDIGQGGDDDVRLQLLDGHADVIGLDVVERGVEARGGVQGDDARGLEHLRAAAAVGQVVGDGDDVAVLQLAHGGDLAGEEAHGRDEGVADILDLIAVVGNLTLQIDAVLECVEVDLAVGEGRCWGLRSRRTGRSRG